MQSIRSKLNDALTSFWGKWFSLSIVIGCVAGLAAILFQFCIQVIQYLAMGKIVGLELGDAAGEYSLFPGASSELQVWLIIPVVTLGGLLTGLIVYGFAPEAEGHGTDSAIEAFHQRRGIIPLRVAIVKLIASAITLGTGGSAGKEGPIAQIGAGFGSFLGRSLKLSTHDRRILLAIGMGAGIGAIFRAPLAGAIFAGEILYRDADIESEVIIPGAISSIIAYAIFQLSLPTNLRFTPLFGDSLQHDVGSIIELIPFTGLAFILVIASVIYVKTFYFTNQIFERIPIIPHLKPCIGAFLTGVVAVSIYFAFGGEHSALASLGSGYGFLQDAVTDAVALSVPLLFVVAFAKILTTSLTIGSGGSGGVFGPSMVIGGALGAGIGKVLNYWAPEISAHPSAFAVVGMAGFFAGCANAPFSTVLMVTELTGDYRLLVPTLWVSSICFVLCRKWSIYSKQVDTRLDSPAHKGDFTVDLLEGILVRDVYRETQLGTTFHEDVSLDEIVHALDDTSQRYFYVYNSGEELVGVFSVEDVRRYLYDDIIWKIAIARDVMTEKVETLQLDDDLNLAFGQFTALNVDELPVIDSGNPNKIIGVVRRKEAIAAYNKRRLDFQKQKEEENCKQK